MCNHLQTLLAKKGESLSTKLQVSVLLVSSQDNSVLASGINHSSGSPSVMTNELEGDNDNQNIVHAEIDALNNLSEDEIDMVMWCSHNPCFSCSKKIIANGNISQVRFLSKFKTYKGLQLLMDNGIECVEIDEASEHQSQELLKPVNGYTILKKEVQNRTFGSGLIIDNNSANTPDEVCIVVSSEKYSSGTRLLVEMQSTMWLDNNMVMFFCRNEDILVTL